MGRSRDRHAVRAGRAPDARAAAPEGSHPRRTPPQMSTGGDGGGSNSPSRTFSQGPLRACPMLCRQPAEPPSAAFRSVQSRPLAGLVFGYATLPEAASPLHDASTAHGDEAASTLTLPPKRRGREQAGCCQLLRFAAGLTRPDGTSARAPWGSGPVETTHPHCRTSVRRPDSSGRGGGIQVARARWLVPCRRGRCRHGQTSGSPRPQPPTGRDPRPPSRARAPFSRPEPRFPGGGRAAVCLARLRARPWPGPSR